MCSGYLETSGMSTIPRKGKFSGVQKCSGFLGFRSLGQDFNHGNKLESCGVCDLLTTICFYAYDVLSKLR